MRRLLETEARVLWKWATLAALRLHNLCWGHVDGHRGRGHHLDLRGTLRAFNDTVLSKVDSCEYKVPWILHVLGGFWAAAHSLDWSSSR